MKQDHVNKMEIVSQRGDKKVDRNWLMPKFKEFINYFNQITHDKLGLSNVEIDYQSFNFQNYNNKFFSNLPKEIYENSVMYKSHRNGFIPCITKIKKENGRNIVINQNIKNIDVDSINKEDVLLSFDKLDEKSKKNLIKKEYLLHYLFNKFEEKAHFIRNHNDISLEENLLYELCSEKSPIALVNIPENLLYYHIHNCPIRTMGFRHIRGTLYNDIIKFKNYFVGKNKVSYSECEKYIDGILDLNSELVMNNIKNVNENIYNEQKELKRKYKINNFDKNNIFSNFLNKKILINLRHGLDLKKTFEYFLFKDFKTEEDILKIIKKNPLYGHYKILLTNEIEELESHNDVEYNDYYQHYLKKFEDLINIGNDNVYKHKFKPEYLIDKQNISKKIKFMLERKRQGKKIKIEDTVDYYIFNHQHCQFYQALNFTEDNKKNFIKEVILASNYYKNDKGELIVSLSHKDLENAYKRNKSKSLKTNSEANSEANLRGNRVEKQLTAFFMNGIEKQDKNVEYLKQYFKINAKSALLVNEVKKNYGGCKTDLVLKDGLNYLGCSVKSTKHNKITDLNLGDLIVDHLIKTILLNKDNNYSKEEKEKIIFLIHFYHNPELFRERFASHEKNELIKFNKNYLSFEEIEKIVTQNNDKNNKVLSRLDWHVLQEINPELYNLGMRFFEKYLKEMAINSLVNQEKFLKAFISVKINNEAEILEKEEVKELDNIELDKEINQEILKSNDVNTKQEKVDVIDIYDVNHIKDLFNKAKFEIINHHLSLTFNEKVIFQLKTYICSSGTKNKDSFEYYKRKGKSRGVLNSNIFNELNPVLSFKERLNRYDLENVKEESIKKVEDLYEIYNEKMVRRKMIN